MSVALEEARPELRHLMAGCRKVPSEKTESGRDKIQSVLDVMCKSAQNIAHLRNVVEGFTHGREAVDFPLAVEVRNALRSSRDPSLDPPPCSTCEGLGFVSTMIHGHACSRECPECRPEKSPPQRRDSPTSTRDRDRSRSIELAEQAGFTFAFEGPAFGTKQEKR
jgi:hypothetical protein